MIPLRKPRPLNPGSTVAVWAPSFPGPAIFPKRFQRGLAALETAGFKVRPGPSCRGHCGYAAAPPQALAAELHAHLLDPEVSGILCAVGGLTINAVLPFIDWALLREHVKVIVGYSDISAFHLAALHLSRIVTFHGPMVISEWGEFGGPWPYTAQSFLDATALRTGRLLLPPEQWTDELLWWDKQDSRRRVVTGTGRWRFLREGACSGRLIAACTPTIARLIGTPYMPDLTGAILCLEDEDFSPDRFWHYLIQFRDAGLLRHLAGLVIGRHCRPRPMDTGYTDFDLLLMEVLAGTQYPVLTDVDFGHTEPMLTLPVGILASLDSLLEGIHLVDPAVAE